MLPAASSFSVALSADVTPKPDQGIIRRSGQTSTPASQVHSRLVYEFRSLRGTRTEAGEEAENDGRTNEELSIMATHAKAAIVLNYAGNERLVLRSMGLSRPSPLHWHRCAPTRRATPVRPGCHRGEACCIWSSREAGTWRFRHYQ